MSRRVPCSEWFSMWCAALVGRDGGGGIRDCFYAWKKTGLYHQRRYERRFFVDASSIVEFVGVGSKNVKGYPILRAVQDGICFIHLNFVIQ